jgi:rubrerythrin
MEKKEEAGKVIGALKKGSELESYGLKFYTVASNEVSDPRGRQTLMYLAKEEKEHLKFINDLRKTFESDHEELIGDIVKSKSESIGLPKVFPEKEEYLSEVKEGRGDRDILEEAALIEKRSMQFYADSAKGIKNSDYREIFNILLKEEEGHLQLIEQMSEYMVLHGVWSGVENYFVNE